MAVSAKSLRPLVLATLALMGLSSALLALTGCAQDLGWGAVERTIESEFPSVAQITTDSLAKRLGEKASPRPLLLDVRQPEEYAVSRLAGARQIAPDAQPDSAASDVLGGALADLPRDAPIVTYCSVGYRSAAMAERLQAAGFTNVSNLKGSIFRWANEGRPVYRGGQRVRAVHPYDRLWGQLLEDNLHAREPAG